TRHSLPRHISLIPSTYFFFTATPTTEIYTLSLHDALPICTTSDSIGRFPPARRWPAMRAGDAPTRVGEPQPGAPLCRGDGGRAAGRGRRRRPSVVSPPRWRPPPPRQGRRSIPSRD